MRRGLFLTILVVACGSVVSGHEVGGLTFEVQDNQRFCFYERFRNSSVYILDYKVGYRPTVLWPTHNSISYYEHQNGGLTDRYNIYNRLKHTTYYIVTIIYLLRQKAAQHNITIKKTEETHKKLKKTIIHKN